MLQLRRPSIPQRRILFAAGTVLLLIAVFLTITWSLLKPLAERQARRLIISSVGQKLHANVTIDTLHLTFHRGIFLDAGNIRALQIDAPSGAPPILTLAVLHARVPVLNLLFQHAQGTHVAARGLVLDLSGPAQHLLAQAASGSPKGRPLPLTRLVVVDSTLKLDPTTPGRSAVVIQCSRLALDSLDDPNGPAAFTADLSAPIPGLHSSGNFGPLNLSSPRDTPISATYQINDAPLNLLVGVTGTASSKGSLAGTLGNIRIDGTAQSPNFALDVSAHPFPVGADFRGVFDLTSGNVLLPAISASFLRTTVKGTGSIDRQPDGRHVSLDVHIRDGRNEDVITLLSQPKAPFFSSMNLDSKIDIPPGTNSLIHRIHAVGRATLSGVLWTNPAIQAQMNSLSMRASGHADQAEDHPASIPLAYSTMSGNFNLREASIAIDHLSYTLPGAAILMQGSYPLIAPELEFHGLVRTVASASHMETGIKSILLKPISPFLKKNGAGMQVPISLTGSKTAPVLALDLSHLHQEKKISQSNPERPHL